jgi:hypothetical protein
VPADGDNVNQAVNDPAFQALANRTKFIVDKGLEGFTTWPQTGRVIWLPLAKGVPLYGSDMRYTLTSAYPSTPTWAWEAHSNSAAMQYGCDDSLRTGMTITGATLLVKAGAARSGANKIRVDLARSDAPLIHASGQQTTLTAIANQSDDGTATAQWIELTGLTELVTRNHRDIALNIKFGNDAGTNVDVLMALGLYVTDPGPRNV